MLILVFSWEFKDNRNTINVKTAKARRGYVVRFCRYMMASPQCCFFVKSV